MHCCKILLLSAYLHLPDGSQAVPNCISSTAMNYGVTWPREICGVLFCLALALHGQTMHHREAHTLSKRRHLTERGGRGASAFFGFKCGKFCSISGRKEQDFRRIPFSLFHIGEKTNQEERFGFAWGCDRAVRAFMGRCPMIHWVIGFRPVLIAGGPRPKNLGGFRRALFSTIQPNGIWSASASRHSRRPSQFQGP